MQAIGKFLGWGLGILVGVMIVGVAGLAIAARVVGKPEELGVVEGRLAPCPDTPNCVSTQSGDPEKRMDPLVYRGSTEEARRRLLDIVSDLPRSSLIEQQPDYLHFLFRSPTFGFPDDVEFYFDESAGLIHFRAAARMGQSDMGANRSRMEMISTMFANASPAEGSR